MSIADVGAGAQFNLGIMYKKGQGVAQNNTEALQWYRKAADQGHSNAQFSLGVIYHQGRGVQQNYTEALRWLLKAADQGHTNAQFNLGIRAMAWYRTSTKLCNGFARPRTKAMLLCSYTLVICTIMVKA